VDDVDDRRHQPADIHHVRQREIDGAQRVVLTALNSQPAQ
jgi:hypothetical protein